MHRWIVASLAPLLWHAAPQAEDVPGTDEALDRQAAVIKPSADELRWRQIPWMTNLAQGQQTAQAEGRPIFLWVTGDDPLERC